MKISIVFPSVMYREGPEGVAKLIQAFEEIGFDEMDMFDHVVMGYPTATRRAPFYTPQMPIMEAMTVLSFAAAITNTIRLGTGVLVLPQRQVTLVAKQASSIDTLSAGRLRLGVGIGWQESEYQALGEDFNTRGRRFAEGIQLMRSCWRDEHINFAGRYYHLDEIAMEPKPPQRAEIPIWIGGTKEPQLKRVAALGDGWMAMTAPGDPPLKENLARMRELLVAEGRDPATFPMQMSLSPDALDREKRKRFYGEPGLMLERTAELRELGFSHVAMDCVPIFQKGYRSVDDMIDYLREIYMTLKPELRD
ncbi:MAG: LLM class F420-dependent oxidoreductase [Gammaproteobacteria bacterium]|nr:LLM class F420-dependent oxidoreductase [Gammaproteobacteria bacterium]